MYISEDRKLLAEKLLNLRHSRISSDFVETIIKFFESKTSIDLGLLPEQFDKISKFLQIKDIIFQSSKNLVQLAVHNFATLLGYQGKIVRSLVDIVTAGNLGEIEISLKNLFKSKVEQSFREDRLEEFAKMAAEELSSVHSLEKTVNQISNVLGFPKFIISRLIAPFLTHAMQLNVNDVCFLFDLVGFNDSTFKKIGLNLNRGLSANKLRYLVANMAIGNIPNMEEVLSIFEIDSRLAKLLEAIIIGRPRITIQLILDLFTQLNQEKLRIPKKVFDFLMALFVFFKGYSASFSFDDPSNVAVALQKAAKTGDLLEQASQQV